MANLLLTSNPLSILLRYLNMVCVEPGFVAGPKTLAPGGTWFLGVESKTAKL